MSDDTKVKVVGLTKKFGDLLVLNDISGENAHADDGAYARDQRDHHRTVLHKQAALTALVIFFHLLPP